MEQKNGLILANGAKERLILAEHLASSLCLVFACSLNAVSLSAWLLAPGSINGRLMWRGSLCCLFLYQLSSTSACTYPESDECARVEDEPLAWWQSLVLNAQFFEVLQRMQAFHNDNLVMSNKAERQEVRWRSS